MKGLKTVAILSGVALIGFGLYRFYKMQVDFLKNIEYKITSIKIKTMTKQLLSIDVSMRLFNYSNIDATVKEIFLDFYINGNKVGNIQESKDLIIKASGQTDVGFTFNVNPSLVLTNIANIVNMSIALKDATVEAKGYVKLESGMLRSTLPFEYKTTFKEYFNVK
jgi:LEA14-like dessication related protein